MWKYWTVAPVFWPMPAMVKDCSVAASMAVGVVTVLLVLQGHVGEEPEPFVHRRRRLWQRPAQRGCAVPQLWQTKAR
mgnify:CR=1 FL=1